MSELGRNLKTQTWMLNPTENGDVKLCASSGGMVCGLPFGIEQSDVVDYKTQKSALKIQIG